ncbi:MAG: uroporphyrinogen decarboxylase family protein, partial [Planctomycetota bacterium]
ETLEVVSTTTTHLGTISSSQRFHREEPSWSVSRPVKNFERELPIYEDLHLGGNLGSMDCSTMIDAWTEVGESYLLEAWLGNPFFDFVAGGREGGLEQSIFDFMEHEELLEGLQERYIDFMVRKARALVEKTPFESFAIGCSWSCNSLIGPDLWRRWDRPVIQAVADELHRHDKLLHIHFHGRCMETVADFAEIGIDCVCPFERPPGGDVEGLEGLQQVAKILDGNVTMNGNIHTVETLIRGTTEDVRREVREVMDAFNHNPRVILGTGDQVGVETPEENLHAMIEEAKSYAPLAEVR